MLTGHSYKRQGGAPNSGGSRPRARASPLPLFVGLLPEVGGEPPQRQLGWARTLLEIGLGQGADPRKEGAGAGPAAFLKSRWEPFEVVLSRKARGSLAVFPVPTQLRSRWRWEAEVPC